MLPDYVDVVRRSTTSNALDPVLPRSILSVTERPQMVVLLVVPGPFWIRGMAALGGLSLGLMFSIADLTETTGNRVEKAGYRAGTAQAVRDRAQLSRDAERTAKRRAAEAEGAARYRRRQGR
jgi:hypothetical protein